LLVIGRRITLGCMLIQTNSNAIQSTAIWDLDSNDSFAPKVNFGEFGDYPARLLIFYHKHEPLTDKGGNVNSSGICTLVHSCEYSVGMM
jgi:hypothetical protein